MRSGVEVTRTVTSVWCGLCVLYLSVTWQRSQLTEGRTLALTTQDQHLDESESLSTDRITSCWCITSVSKAVPTTQERRTRLEHLQHQSLRLKNKVFDIVCSCIIMWIKVHSTACSCGSSLNLVFLTLLLFTLPKKLLHYKVKLVFYQLPWFQVNVLPSLFIQLLVCLPMLLPSIMEWIQNYPDSTRPPGTLVPR